ncbi:SLAM family member 5-like [Mixophyes fleayi]|uniref:SLAM family member 5-like n=1 Tax=Mixophyes fleayi TaxID=3061075 RepID=UPI003F4DA2AB
MTVTAVGLVSVLLPLMVSAGRDAAVQVNGLLHQSVELFNYLHLPLPVTDVVWHLVTNGKKIKLATFGNNQLVIANHQFTDRLEVSNNGTILRISDLRMEDTGGYAAQTTLTDLETRDTYYFLTVYEPVPTPDIRTEGKNVTGDWCNDTLHCYVPTNTSVLSYTWKYRDSGTEYKIYNNGNTIKMSLQPESWDMEFLCIVHNPADQKNVSVHVREKCPAIDQPRQYLYLLSIIILLLLIILGLIIWKIRRKEHGHTELEYCTPELPIYQSPNVSIQNLSYDERADHPNPAHQEFASLYASLDTR